MLLKHIYLNGEEMNLEIIEKISFSMTEFKILDLLKTSDNKCISLSDLKENINVLFATVHLELRKLEKKGVIKISEQKVFLTDLGKSILRFQNFKENVFKDFCRKNCLGKAELSKFTNDRNYNNMKLLLGIKNML